MGANIGTSSHFFLGVFLIHNNLSISEIELVNIKTIDLSAALKNNEVDAISVWQPHSQEAKRLLQNIAIELPSSEIYRTTFNFAVIKSFTEDHPEILEKILRSVDKAAVFIKGNKKQSEEIIVNSFSFDKKVIHEAWDDFVFDISLDQSLLVAWDEIARWAIENKFVDSKELPNYLNFLYMDSLDAVKPASNTVVR